MRRRDVITLIGGAALAMSRIAHAQAMRRIVILLTVAEQDLATQGWVSVFRNRLTELGWVEGRNIRFELRWAASNPQRIQANVAETMGSMPDLIVAQNTPMAVAIRKHSSSVPVVFVQVSDPVGDGIVTALARPGGNITGFTNTISTLGGKWLELLHDAAPRVSRVGFLYNKAVAPGGGSYYLEPFHAAAKSLGIDGVALEVGTTDEIEPAITKFSQTGGNGIVTNSDAFITVNRERIIAVANRLLMPATYVNATFTHAGGLMSYGADTEQQWLAAAGYVDRILRGEKPSNLPVQQPAKFVLSINLKTAKAINLDVPLFLQQRADEVIE